MRTSESAKPENSRIFYRDFDESEYDILSVLDAEQFQRCFVDWVAALTGAPKEVIAIDGKSIRRSFAPCLGQKRQCRTWSASRGGQQRMVFAQMKVEEKENEIVAIPKLLELLGICAARW